MPYSPVPSPTCVHWAQYYVLSRAKSGFLAGWLQSVPLNIISTLKSSMLFPIDPDMRIFIHMFATELDCECLSDVYSGGDFNCGAGWKGTLWH